MAFGFILRRRTPGYWLQLVGWLAWHCPVFVHFCQQILALFCRIWPDCRSYNTLGTLGFSSEKRGFPRVKNDGAILDTVGVTGSIPVAPTIVFNGLTHIRGCPARVLAGKSPSVAAEMPGTACVTHAGALVITKFLRWLGGCDTRAAAKVFQFGRGALLGPVFSLKFSPARGSCRRPRPGCRHRTRRPGRGPARRARPG